MKQAPYRFPQMLGATTEN